MSGKNNQILSKPLFKLLILFNIMVFILFLSVLYDSFSGQVRHQQALVENFAHSMKLRIDTYRFATWQIYQDQTTGSDNDPTSNPLAGESRLRSDVYAPNGDEDKTHVLIFAPITKPPWPMPAMPLTFSIHYGELKPIPGQCTI